ncbi:MAG: imelysin family protein [Pseudomonadota bacterium]|nr:imelysin family protein [Pseudomonadota bacterium]
MSRPGETVIHTRFDASMRQRNPAGVATLAATLLVACGTQAPPDPARALESYRSVAHSEYRAALAAARTLQTKIQALTTAASPDSLAAARKAWVSARKPYARTEALRFGHWFVDEWEARVNRWPIHPEFLDYVDQPEAPSQRPLVVSQRIRVAGRTLDASIIDRRLLLDIQALSTDPTQVVTGYHAIEFMLWGEDPVRHDPKPGARPWTDYATDAALCTRGSQPAPPTECKRRGELLTTMAELLVWELERMAAVWADKPGTYGYRLVHGDAEPGLHKALYGLVTFSASELASTRLDIPLRTRAPERIQDQFSNTSHTALYHSALGVEQLYYGRLDQQKASVSLASLARHADANLAGQIDRALATTRQRLARIQQMGQTGQVLDQLIAPGHVEGSRVLADAIIALRVQSALLSRLGEALGLGPLDPNAAADDSTS